MHKEINYTLLPEHTREGMRRYIEEGIRPGHFMCAVLSNKLVESFCHADQINDAAMRQYVWFVSMELPSEAWGSEKKVEAWCQSRQLGQVLSEALALKPAKQ